MRKQARYILGALVLIIVLFSLPYIFTYQPLSLIPSFEGLDMGMNGVKVIEGSSSGQYFKLDTSLPSPYRWIEQGVHNTILQHDSVFLVCTTGQVRVETQKPVPYSSWFEQGKEVNYWVKRSENDYAHVKGQINIYTVHVTVSGINTGNIGQYIFHGEKIWMQLKTLAWDRAVQEQNYLGEGTFMGTAWEAPLGVFISEYTIRDYTDVFGTVIGEIDPSVQGRFVDLYTGAEEYGTLDDFTFKEGGDVNATLSNVYQPDSKMQPDAYFPITLTKWKVEVSPIGSKVPQADYTLKVYTIQLGQWTYTNPDDTPWGERQKPEDIIGQILRAIFSNPVNTLAFMLFMVAVFFLIIVIVSPATAIVLIYAFTGRKRKAKMRLRMREWLFLFAFVLVITVVMYFFIMNPKVEWTIKERYAFGEVIQVAGHTAPLSKVVIYFKGAYPASSKTFSTNADFNGDFSFSVRFPEDFNPDSFGTYPVYVESYDALGWFMLGKTGSLNIEYVGG